MPAVIDPRFTNLLDWTAKSSVALAPYGQIPILRDEENWRDWGNHVAAIPAIAGLNPPRPATFRDWRMWAMALNDVVRLLPT